MTYRISDHSTSDNSLLYRDKSEIDNWKLKDPKIWIKKLLENHDSYDSLFENEIKLNNEKIR